jgi:hypothetical protein
MNNTPPPPDCDPSARAFLTVAANLERMIS